MRSKIAAVITIAALALSGAMTTSAVAKRHTSTPAGKRHTVQPKRHTKRHTRAETLAGLRVSAAVAIVLGEMAASAQPDGSLS